MDLFTIKVRKINFSENTGLAIFKNNWQQKLKTFFSFVEVLFVLLFSVTNYSFINLYCFYL